MPATPNRSFITVVSGVPRSGTSMMMQLLDAGGVPPMTDLQRVPDADNPRGYFELEAVKRIDTDASFLAEAQGKAIKLIHALVIKLPAGHSYRVIFMRRSTAQIVASQRTMLERGGRKGAALPPEKLQSIFEKQIAETLGQLAKRSDVKLIEVDYEDVLNNTSVTVEQINAFLGGSLMTDAMASAVDPELHRNRS